MARVRRRRGRRARRHDGDRGRHRRAQRDGDARRGRRALRHHPAAPAARARRPRRARVAVPAVRAEGRPRGCRRWQSTRDGFELAEIDLELRGEGELAGTRQSGLAQFAVARLPEDERAARGARRRTRERAAGGRPRARSSPSTRCSRDELRARRGRAASPRREGRRRAATAGAGSPRPPGSETRPTGDRVREALFASSAPRSRARACSTCSPARARWASRRSRAARERPCSSTARRGDRGRARQPRGARHRRPRCAPRGARGAARRHPAGRRHTIWSSSTPPTGAPPSWGGSSRRRWPRCWPPAPASSPRATAALRSSSTCRMTDERRYGDTLIRIHAT